MNQPNQILIFEFPIPFGFQLSDFGFLSSFACRAEVRRRRVIGFDLRPPTSDFRIRPSAFLRSSEFELRISFVIWHSTFVISRPSFP